MRLIALLLLPAAVPAAAHGGTPASAGHWPLLTGACLTGIAWGLYEAGARRVPPSSGRRACFHGALVIGILAAFGPFDAWADRSTAMHMVQHMLLMVVVAPLAALASPLPQWRTMTGRQGRKFWASVQRGAGYPLAMTLIHGGIIWVWHAPRLYRLALDHPWWHLAEHAAFLLSAWLFWWSVLHAGRRQWPLALLALLLTLIHTGLLGALLSFGRTSFYGQSRSLEDQQLAGLIMWVPGGLVYVAGAGWIVWRRLSRAFAAQGWRQEIENG